MSGNNLNDITAAKAAAITALTAKNRGSAATAVGAVSFAGNDRNLMEKLATAAGVTVTYQGSDENFLALFSAAVAALSTL